MKFRDLETGQQFRWLGMPELWCKTGPGGYVASEDKDRGLAHYKYLGKRQRDGEVIPEGEPPSSIAAAERDKRWWILTNMDVNADEVRALRDREGIGIFEGARMLKRHNLQNGLDVLKSELQDVDEKTQRVLHDLIEIVRELI